LATLFIKASVDEAVEQKIKENIQALDKSLEESKSKYIGYQSYHSGYDWQEDRWENGKWQDKREEGKSNTEINEYMHKRKKLRKEFALSKNKAEKFENCDLGQCDRCEDMVLCQNYLYNLEVVEEGGEINGNKVE